MAMEEVLELAASSEGLFCILNVGSVQSRRTNPENLPQSSEKWAFTYNSIDLASIWVSRTTLDAVLLEVEYRGL